MKKRDSHFKLSKSAKRILANVIDPHLYGAQKNIYIEGEIAAAQQLKKEKQEGSRSKTATQTTQQPE